jgi:3-phosphoshikimate 1-carboxyvinyltransferase
MSSKSEEMVYPASLRDADIQVPGDKSISQRAVMMASLAQGSCRLSGVLRGEDAMSTLHACEALGASSSFEGDDLVVTGAGHGWNPPQDDLDLGNSGTGMRLMSGLLAGQPFSSRLVGDQSLSRRPMGRIVEPLRLMGADIQCTGAEGTRPPLVIHGRPLKAIEYKMPMASAQVKSCVLLAGLFAEGRTSVVEPAPCRDHTETLLQALGLPLDVNGNTVSVQGFGQSGPVIKAFDWQIPGDFSSAAFWLAAAACTDGVTFTLSKLGLNERRTGFLSVLRDMGADLSVSIDPDAPVSEPYGTIRLTGKGLRGCEIGGDIIPNIIDELPIAAVCAALAEGQTVIRDAEELRVKESDRISIMVQSLQAAGVDVQEQPDGMIIQGSGGQLFEGGCTIDSHHDHRIAMSLSILALFCRNPITIQGVDCVNTSYPGFYDQLRSVCDV